MSRDHTSNVNGFIHQPMTTNFGVPQSTLLGPKLFDIYLNYLFSVETNWIAYAENTSVF